MPVFQRATDGSTAQARVQQEGRERIYRLSREGTLFLTEILGVREGEEFRPADLQLLVDRGWAEPVPEPERPQVPEPVPPPAVPPPAPSRTEPSPAAIPRTTVNRRTRGREVALQVLYMLEQHGSADPKDIERFITRRLGEPKLAGYTRELVEGIRARLAELDEQIGEVAENWRVDRMAAIDRNILRLGAFEILYSPGVPRKVAINESLELAKRYSTAQSSRFVNGILDRLGEQKPAED